jgi:uncharacterized protein YkvS
MGNCCKTKQEEGGINYSDDDMIPKFDIQPKENMKAVRGGVQNMGDYGNYNENININKSKGMMDNPKYNKTYGEDRRMNEYENQNSHWAKEDKKTELVNMHHNGMKFLADRNDEPVNYNKRLYLKIKDSKFNKIGQVLEITQNGLTGSTRNVNDGYVYFGLHSLDVKNDFCFKAEEGVNKQHFEIKFESHTKPGYYVKNLLGSGVFIKIEDYLNLKDGVIISFGTNHLLVSISTADPMDQRDNASTIKFKAIYGPNKQEE